MLIVLMCSLFTSVMIELMKMLLRYLKKNYHKFVCTKHIAEYNGFLLVCLLGFERERSRVWNSSIEDAKGYKCFIFIAGALRGYGVSQEIGRVEESIVETPLQDEKTTSRNQNQLPKLIEQLYFFHY